MKQEMITGTVGTALGIIGTATQTEQVLRIVSLVMTIIGALITYVALPLLAWYKKSKADGKITADEVKEGVEIIKDGTEKVQDEVNKNNEK